MIYIGIPVHNERDTIGPLLWRIRELLYGERREFHVLVCDDASDDGTAESLAQYPPTLPMTLLHNETREGYAACLERLIRATVERSAYPKRDALVTMQGDFSDSPERIPEMMRRFEGGADLVTLERNHAEPRPRRLARLGGRVIARGLHPPSAATDPYASLRLYRLFTLARAVEAAGRSHRLLEHEGWAANAELLLRVWRFLRRHEEVPAEPARERRYRESRFRASDQLRGLFRAGRDPELKALGRSAREAA
ncbi:MAG: glycosyltransferase [Gemmatimonadetes bacterium]|nr:glycosyltransferase [Gemmatimonadota bacterium]